MRHAIHNPLHLALLVLSNEQRTNYRYIYGLQGHYIELLVVVVLKARPHLRFMALVGRVDVQAQIVVRRVCLILPFAILHFWLALLASHAYVWEAVPSVVVVAVRVQTLLVLDRLDRLRHSVHLEELVQVASPHVRKETHVPLGEVLAALGANLHNLDDAGRAGAGGNGSASGVIGVSVVGAGEGVVGVSVVGAGAFGRRCLGVGVDGTGVDGVGGRKVPDDRNRQGATRCWPANRRERC